MNREREAKLAAPAGFRLPDLADTAPGVVVTTGIESRLVTVYWDTADLRLIRWGCSLRHRAGEGWTVKLPVARGRAMIVRDEHEFPGEPRRPPAAALDLVRACLRNAAVAPIIRMRTRRRPVRLHDADGRLLAEVDDDEVSVYTGRHLASRFRELEVELGESGTEPFLALVVERLRMAGCGLSESTPKIVRALGDRALAPADVVVEAVGRHATTAAAVRRAIAGSVVRLIRHDPGVQRGGDLEDVHQARVATRRLRSDLRTFGPVLDPEWVASLREELRWLGGELGAVRDAEVLADRLRRTIGRLPERDRDTAGRLTAELDGDVAQARVRLIAAMREPRYLALIDRLVAAASMPPVLSDAPAAEVLVELVLPLWSRLRRAARRIDESSPDDELHMLRIRAKRCRYAAEAVAPVIGPRASAFASGVADLQEVLGDHQDAVIAAAWLREHAAACGDPYVAGELGGMERAAAHHSRELWPSAWRRLRTRKLSAWLRKGRPLVEERRPRVIE